MSVPALQKLTIKHLRGSVETFELAFEKSKNLTVIYGENGTGKSTICDALELLGKGQIGSLENRGLGKAVNKYWNAVGKTAADVSVTLMTASGSCSATLTKAKPVISPEDAKPKVEVLRRSQILDLIEAQPGQRYATISRFIDVSAVEVAEDRLRKHIAVQNDALNVSSTRIAENLEALESFWAVAGKPGASAQAWAKAALLASGGGVTDPMIDLLPKLRADYERLASFPAQLDAAQAALDAAQAALDSAQAAAAAALHTAAGDAGELLGLLDAARRFLHAHPDAATCPLCEQPAAAADILAAIDQRQAAFAAVRTAQQAQRDSAATFAQAQQQVAWLRSQAQQAAAQLNALLDSANWASDVTPPAHVPDVLVDGALAAWLSSAAPLLDGWRQAEARRQDQKKFLHALQGAVSSLEANEATAQLQRAQLPRLKQALEIVQKRRKAFTDKLLDSIAAEVGRMYEAVHPGEGLNKITMALDGSRRASLGIGTTFAGVVGQPPQAYLSQSHLDTLGLCVFLALAAQDAPKETILVLDDVLASVDEPHVDRLIQMLYTEATRFRHCIVTTHYGPWRHKLRWGWLKNNQCQFVELSHWSHATGISAVRSVPEVERLRDMLAASPPDHQAICAKSGVILEAALDFLTQLYECSVPRKSEPRYTLGELLPAVKGKLRKGLRVEVRQDATDGTIGYTSVPLGPMLDELERIMQTRNVMGCHFNALSFNLLDSDALVFSQKVLELIDALADPAVGWPRNSKSGSYWANSGETRRLYPLQTPS